MEFSLNRWMIEKLNKTFVVRVIYCITPDHLIKYLPFPHNLNQLLIKVLLLKQPINMLRLKRFLIKQVLRLHKLQKVFLTPSLQNLRHGLQLNLLRFQQHFKHNLLGFRNYQSIDRYIGRLHFVLTLMREVEEVLNGFRGVGVEDE